MEEPGQLDLFRTRSTDAAPKSDLHSLEFPFFSLSKNPLITTRVYDSRGVKIEVIPSSRGAPTQWDKDVLIYAATVVSAALERGCTPESTRTLKFPPYDLLRATQRGLTGRDYARLGEALIRLRGAVIRTSISTGGVEASDGFGFIESFKWRRRLNSTEGYIQLCLSDWFHRAVLANEILTLDPRYFSIESALGRRLYELVRNIVATRAVGTLASTVSARNPAARRPRRVSATS